MPKIGEMWNARLQTVANFPDEEMQQQTVTVTQKQPLKLPDRTVNYFKVKQSAYKAFFDWWVLWKFWPIIARLTRL